MSLTTAVLGSIRVRRFLFHNSKNKEFSAKEKLEIVISAAEPRITRGFPRHQGRRNWFGLS
ncbi:hypothetical protein A3E62_00560 [Candidatus Giovannonibacteria bacterium RIFCSPHIGHO2_12_FULL_44_29]|nr:MAG: hypothetical protein A3E62_00560 [Candidatus Giovannonibacteria bacterium RIFCSPHIGHO2_12_FULL_44_29]